MDGGGTASDSDFQTIKVWTPLTVEYCVIKDSPAAIYAGNGSVTVRYNLLEAFGWAPPDHANAIYVFGSNNPNASTLIAYNTVYSGELRDSSGLPIGLGAAIAFFDDGGNFYKTEVSNNTVVSVLPGGASYLIGYYVYGSHSATGGNIHDNYLSWANGGAFGAFYNGSSGVVSATYANNVHLDDGNVINGNNTETGGSTPGLPTISSFSSDSGMAGDHITNDNTLSLTGTAPANSTVNIFDGTKQLGAVTANSSGVWSYTTAALADGGHSFTATDIVGGTTSSPSSPFSITLDTVAPAKPVIAFFSTDSGTVGDGITNDHTLALTGTAEANSKVSVYDGAMLLGTATTNASGAWSYTTGTLLDATHSFSATATDAAGNASTASTALVVTVIPSSGTTPTGSVSINDVTISEGNSGTKVETFTVTRSGGTAAFAVNYATSNGSATVADNDYAAASGTLNFGANENTKTFSVTINGDTKVEGNETFNVGLSNATNGATISDGQGVGTITNDDAAAIAGSVSINDVTISEGNSGTKVETFTVTRTGGTAAFGVNYATSNGTATVADNDYVAASGTLNFGANENTKTISVTINGDTKVEANETFNIVLSNATNGATISDGRGVGTITNDDGDTVAPAKPAISAFSTDTGVKGDGITNDHTLALTGAAEANSTVSVYDGTKLLGTAKANSSGAWSYTTGTLLDATHSFTATASDAAGNVSAASQLLAVTVATPGAVYGKWSPSKILAVMALRIFCGRTRPPVLSRCGP